MQSQAGTALEREAREWVVETAFAHGRAGAVDRSGLGASVVDGIVDHWLASREGDVVDAQPDTVALDEVRTRLGGAIAVADLDNDALVEVLPDREALSRWLARPGMAQPLRVGLPVDAALATIVRGAVPGVRLLVAPVNAMRAVRAALAAGLSALRREPGMSRRNAFPGSARFLRALDGRVAACGGWPVEVTALLSAGRAAEHVVRAPDAREGARRWPEMELALSVPGAAPLARLMRTWREAILEGLDNRFVDRASAALSRVRRMSVSRRPSLLPRDLRGLYLLRDCRRGLVYGAGGDEAPVSVPLGRSLDGLVTMLAASGTGPVHAGP